jgi:predicted ABC-type ATPase
MRPRMVVIAGPPGSGKSTAFPASSFGLDAFNADDRAAELHGSYARIPPPIRERVTAEFEEFIDNHIREQKSFAVETTLRTDITFRQAALARDQGYFLNMRYIGVERVEQNIERIAARADAGGHSAPAAKIRLIRKASLGNLPRALREFDRVRVYDNSDISGPRCVLETNRGRITSVAAEPETPRWLERTLMSTPYALKISLRDHLPQPNERGSSRLER